MNNDKISGLVEAIGEKFNGSVKVDGKWFNFKKGVKNTAQIGDMVALTLGKWSFGGREGVNVTDIDVLAVVGDDEEKAVATPAVSKSPQGRDFDKEARGKTLCQYITAQLSNPSIDNTDLKGIYDRAFDLMNMTFNGVNG